MHQNFALRLLTQEILTQKKLLHLLLQQGSKQTKKNASGKVLQMPENTVSREEVKQALEKGTFKNKITVFLKNSDF